MPLVGPCLRHTEVGAIQLDAATDGPRDHVSARSSITARGPRLSVRDVGQADDMIRKGGFHVNPGRLPTRLGGDGIQPYALVPHAFCALLVEHLRRKQVEVQVRCGAKDFVHYHEQPSQPFPSGRVDPVDHQDRLTFPGGDATRIVAVLNSIEFDPGW
jgi:hypothetical protein